MSAEAARERVDFEGLAWISGCLGLALLAQVTSLPVWVTATAIATVALRLGLSARGRDAPPRGVRLIVSVGTVGALFLQFRTFNGISAGTALLCLIAGLKLLETRTRRDIHVIAMIIYFLSLSALLHSQSFGLLSYLVGVIWLTTSVLLRSGTGAAGRWRGRLRYSGRILAQALPLALAFWLFFPRFGGPLWHLPEDGREAASGLGDSMSPGDITDLALSEDVAFRARFEGITPPAAERYWRGPVLHDFDGHTWRRTDGGPVAPPPLRHQGPAYRYTVSLEPNQRNWIFVLDWPAQSNAERGSLTGDYMLVQTRVIDQPVDVTATSYTHVEAGEPLTAVMRKRDTRLPPNRNPRTSHLAESLRRAHPDDMDYVHAVLALFRDQPFYYTLTPPPLDDDSVDGFLFDTRRGFCGHYASAFAALMRAAGIPARVVTGYHGGTYNRFAGYWILRQSDAHAWDEIWIEGRGWQRMDPTAAIAPERVEKGSSDAVSPGHPFASRWQQRAPWLADTRLRLDALRLLWRQRILGFNQGSQERLLAWLHVPDPDGQKVALMLAASLIAGMLWLTWQVHRELVVPKDPAARAYERLCRRLARVGIPRQPHEGAEDFAARVAAVRPDLAVPVSDLCRRYSDLRYAANAPAARAPADGAPAADRGSAIISPATPPRAAIAAFIAAVRRFKPRGSRASS